MFSSIPSTWYDVGKLGKQELFDLIKENQDYLNGQLSTLQAANIPNGSFEVDSDSNGVPDQWTPSYYAGGSGALETTAPAHGSQAWKFIHPGGAGNGGGYMDSDYIEVADLAASALSFIHWASAAGMKNQVIIRYFDKAQAYISAETIYSSTSNPTAATLFRKHLTIPSTARYITVRLVGGLNDTDVAGSAYFDMVKLELVIDRAQVFTSDGSYIVPSGVNRIYAVCVGGGGGGGSGASNGGGASGGGGGAGGVIEGWIGVTPGENLTIDVGAGGAGGASVGQNATGNNGVTGSDTTLKDSGAVGLMLAPGGARGIAAVYPLGAGSGGAGGQNTSTIERLLLKTTNGGPGAWTSSTGEDGGAGGAASPWRGIGGAGGVASGSIGGGFTSAAVAGSGIGAGGGGGAGNDNNGGQAGAAGSAGAVIIFH